MNDSENKNNTTTVSRLTELLEYVQHLGQLKIKPAFTVAEYKQLSLAEYELQNRIGLQHNLTDADNEPVWLQIERLKRLPPPTVSTECLPWIVVGNDPEQQPQIKDQRMETLDAEQVKQLLTAETITQADINEPLKETARQQGKKDVVLHLKHFPDIRRTIDTYLSQQWAPWAESEKPRRETMAIYDALFSLQQTFEAQGDEQPLELVWGVGISRWKYESHKIDHPLLAQLVEIDIDQRNGDLRIRPRELEPELAYGPYFALDISGTETLLRFNKKHFAELSEDVEFSPFVSESFEPVLRQAATQLSESGCYWPDNIPDKSDRQPPTITQELQITDGWILFARPRSQTSFIQDVDRFAEQVKQQGETVVSATAKRLVTELSDKRPVLAGIGGGSGFGGDSGGAGASASSTNASTTNNEVFFPKPFNDAQLQIIERLNNNDGAVVQGPPGTGKTHTIANIICHYLATGRSVLVTSKGEAALSVVREQIPEEVRDLTISLLSNERTGLKQLEGAVRLLNSIVSQSNAGVLQREINQLEQRVKQLRKEIAGIDKELLGWGEKQLAPIAESLAGTDVQMTAMELATHVMVEQSQHHWFPDSLGVGDQYQPRFSDQDIIALSDARTTLGKDISYVKTVLPSINDLPDAQTLSHIHEDLVTAQRMGESAESKGLPVLAVTQSDAVSRAKIQLANLQKLKELVTELKQLPWLQCYFDHLIGEGDQHERFLLFEELLPNLEKLVNTREQFIREPVNLPDPSACRADVNSALLNLTKGQKPFGLFEFGKKEAKALIDAIEIAGEQPTSERQWQHVLDYLQFQDDAKRFVVHWNSVGEEFELPELKAQYAASYRALAAHKKHIDDCRAFALEIWPTTLAEMQLLFPRGLQHSTLFKDETELTTAIDAIESNTSRVSLGIQRQKLNDIDKKLAVCSGLISENLKQFVNNIVGNKQHNSDSIIKHWASLLTELERVHALQSLLDQVSGVTDLIRESGAGNWALALLQPTTDDVQNLTPANWSESWRWMRQRAYLESIDGRAVVNTLTEKRASLDDDQKRAYGELVKKKTHLGLHSNMSERVQGALQRFVSAIARMGKGQGKRAPRHRRDAAKAMKQCYDGVPCWVMPTWRISESLPSTFGSFDLVIIDEASQSDISALPAILRAKKVLIVGDDKQVSPTAGFIAEDKVLQLKHNFLRDQPFQELLLPGASIYDLANALFPGQRVMLTEHFRCVEPIIQFSTQFYSEPLIPLRLPNISERLDPPLIDIYVPDGNRNPRDINELEIEAIVEEIKSITNNSQFTGRSIGVISLIGAKQAHAIQEQLLTELGEDLYQRFNIACGDSATFQGKERDIMFLSMVVGSGQGAALTKREYEQRFNVAMSRARDRMYLVRSVTQEDLGNDNDLRLKVLRHFADPMPVVDNIDEPLKLCDSGFERDVFQRLNVKGYRVSPQVKVGPFSIDLVVEGDNDRRLAIELDGDRYHPPEQWTADFSRQRTMERVGWVFWRCWGSSYQIDPDSCIDELVSTLTAMGIDPGGSSVRNSVYTQSREFKPVAKVLYEQDTLVFE